MSSQSALSDLRVLDLSRFIAGPYCAQLLGDQGADVVKVERPNGGDDTRGVHPQVEGESLYFMAFNRNKRGITLDFRNPAAQERLRALISKADIVVENFRPGTMEKMGCGYETLRELNPRLIMVRISGFGSEGPLADQPCFDIIAQAMSGIMSITGEPDGSPMKAGTYLVDYATALYATIGVLSAVEARHRTGRGQLVEVNLLDSAMSMLMTGIPEALMLNRDVNRLGNRDLFTAPANSYRAADGVWVQISAGNQGHFARLAQAMDKLQLPTDPRFATVALRMENIDAIDAIVAGWAAEHSADDILARLQAAEVPSARIATVAEAVRNPHVAARKTIVAVDHPRAGPVPLQGPIISLSETPATIRRPAPMLGEHSDDVFADWLGG
jgi:crotonobetainyl-CoA:carnitine CoA-transferase CaiB-like acyl-CoA transferase